jgi:hypothetical protein
MSRFSNVGQCGMQASVPSSKGDTTTRKHCRILITFFINFKVGIESAMLVPRERRKQSPLTLG